MNKYFKYYFILIIGCILVNCAGKKDIQSNTDNKKNNKESTLIQDSSPFYPLSQSIADIQTEIISVNWDDQTSSYT